MERVESHSVLHCMHFRTRPARPLMRCLTEYSCDERQSHLQFATKMNRMNRPVALRIQRQRPLHSTLSILHAARARPLEVVANVCMRFRVSANTWAISRIGPVHSGASTIRLHPHVSICGRNVLACRTFYIYIRSTCTTHATRKFCVQTLKMFLCRTKNSVFAWGSCT